MGYELRVFFKRLEDGSELDLIETIKRKHQEQLGKTGKNALKNAKEPTRTDIYVNFGEPSVGLKLRHGKKLELKLRHEKNGQAYSSSSPIDEVSKTLEDDSDGTGKIPKVEYWKKSYQASVSAPLSATRVMSAYFPASSLHEGQNRVRDLLQKHAQASDDDIFTADAFPTVVFVKDRIQQGIPFNWYSKIYQGHATVEQTDLQVKVKSSSTSASSSASPPSENYHTELWRTIAIEGASEASLRSMWMYLFPDKTQYVNIFDGGYPEFTDYILSQSYNS